VLDDALAADIRRELMLTRGLVTQAVDYIRLPWWQRARRNDGA
jgi:hypothetical protein